MDDDSGLALLGDRYYDASTGRFLSRDPSQEGSNWYIYVDNNPLTFADPDGNEVISLIIVGGLLVWRIYDTVTTVKDIIENPKDPTNYLGFVPGVGRVAKAIGKGSKPVGKAISNTAKKIAHGHAWKKHKHQFPWMTGLLPEFEDVLRVVSSFKGESHEKVKVHRRADRQDPRGGRIWTAHARAAL